MMVSEYEVYFSQSVRHVTTIIPKEVERVCQFMRGLTYLIKQSVFWVSRDRASFQSVVSTAKEKELM